MKKQVGEKIRQVRVVNNLSQDNIASELGISIGAYSNIERGKTDITVSRLFEIAKILKTTILELLSMNTTNTKFSEPQIKQNPLVNTEYGELKEQLNKLQKEITILKTKEKKRSSKK